MKDCRTHSRSLFFMLQFLKIVAQMTTFPEFYLRIDMMKNKPLIQLPSPPAGRAVTFSLQLEKVTKKSRR